MIRTQPPLEHLTGVPIQTARNDRSCVHIQPDTRTLNLHWGLPHLVALPTRTTSCRQPTFTCERGPSPSYRLVGFIGGG